MGKIVAGIPSNRPELCKKAVEAWRERKEFDEIWVMWDTKAEPCFVEGNFRGFRHDENEPSCIPTGSGCCRSRLVLEAWKNPDVEWLVHLDDDVVPTESYTWKEMIEGRHEDPCWFKVIPRAGLYSRGHPYEVRETNTPKIVHGVWNGIPDVDAATQLGSPKQKRLWGPYPMSQSIPRGQYFAMSSMAVAIHRDLFPASYFMWMGKDLPLNKFGDIWCGVILKRICDHFGWLVTSGAPVVYHERASNVWENLRQECKCIEHNEHWWLDVDAVDLHLCLTVSQCYRQIATQMEMPKIPAFEELRAKMLEWVSEFD